MESILSVSQLNKYIAYRMKDDAQLKRLMIKGEICNFTNHQVTGHYYFTLKDKSSLIKAIMFGSHAGLLKFLPENGMNVIVSASVQVFERDGVYQLYVTDMQPDGLGALFMSMEQLKSRLLAEGLFDEEHKKPLPQIPSVVGVVTSSSGAALQDIINVISRRYSAVKIEVYPVQVQGDLAVQEISSAICQASESKCDVIIVGRGGGSLEDLMAFNSENVARAIYNCKIPVVSAVGHETDTTISDLVADMRAPTPSAAAEIVVPDKINLLKMLQNCEELLYNKILRTIEAYEQRINDIQLKLSGFSVETRAEKYEMQLDNLSKRLQALTLTRMSKWEHDIDRLAVGIQSNNPLKLLRRGYSLVYNIDNHLTSSIAGVKDGDTIRIQLSDGEIIARVGG